MRLRVLIVLICFSSKLNAQINMDSLWRYDMTLFNDAYDVQLLNTALKSFKLDTIQIDIKNQLKFKFQNRPIKSLQTKEFSEFYPINITRRSSHSKTNLYAKLQTQTGTQYLIWVIRDRGYPDSNSVEFWEQSNSDQISYIKLSPSNETQIIGTFSRFDNQDLFDSDTNRLKKCGAWKYYVNGILTNTIQKGSCK